jgi:hypothetical protein
MKTAQIILWSVACGIAIGYAASLFLRLTPLAAQQSISEQSLTRVLASCDLSNQQLDLIADRLAPAIAKRLDVASFQHANPENSPTRLAAVDNVATVKHQQAEAFEKAARMVDQMIANKLVTPEGMNEASQLLSDSGQTDRVYLLGARVSAAVNRHELTPAQAGLLVPDSRD